MKYEELMERAIKAREYAYTPYSRFKVGAALLCKNGKVYTGCNVETATFSPTSCAERTAIVKAVSEGDREFAAIAVVGALEGKPFELCTPCGVCRQMLREFADPKAFDIIVHSDEGMKVFTLEQLLPLSFGAENLK